MRKLLVLIVGFAIGPHNVQIAGAEGSKLQPPSTETVVSIRKVIDEAYSLGKAKEPSALKAKAMELRDLAATTETPDDEKYVALLVAAELAQLAADLELWVALVELRLTTFDLDKWQIYSEGIHEFASAPRKAIDSKLQSLAIQTADLAAESGDLDGARKFLRDLQSVLIKRLSPSRPDKSKTAMLAEHLVRLDERARQDEAYRSSQDRLAKNPHDGAAHFTVGSWLVVRKKDWASALNAFSECDQKQFVEAAKRELSSETPQAIADIWLSAADSYRGSSALSDALIGHVIHWYEQAAKTATPLSRKLLETKISQLKSRPHGERGPDNTRFEPLFNGRDLSNWDPKYVGTGQWTVDAGILRGRADEGSFLLAKAPQVTTVHIHYRARVSVGTEGAIAVGCVPVAVDKKLTFGARALLTAGPDGSGGTITRSTNVLAAAKQQRVTPFRWFTGDFIVAKDKIVSMIDGQVVATSNYRSGSSEPQGIAVQLNSKGSLLEFSEISYRIPDSAVSAIAIGRDTAPTPGSLADRRLNHPQVVGLPIPADDKERQKIVAFLGRLNDLPPVQVSRDTKTGALLNVDEDFVIVGQEKGKHQDTYFGDPNWKEYDLSLDVRIERQGELGVFCSSVNNDTSRWILNFCAFGNKDNADLLAYVEGEYPWKHPSRRWKPNSIKMEFGRWYELIMKVRQVNIEIAIDGHTLCKSSHEKLNGGRVGFHGRGLGIARFRNVRITAPNGDLLWTGVPRVN